MRDRTETRYTEPRRGYIPEVVNDPHSLAGQASVNCFRPSTRSLRVNCESLPPSPLRVIFAGFTLLVDTTVQWFETRRWDIRWDVASWSRRSIQQLGTLGSNSTLNAEAKGR